MVTSRSRTNAFRELGLKPGAGPREIKKAYHRMAHQFHPDKNRGNENAAERFRAAKGAYELLTDDDAKGGTSEALGGSGIEKVRFCRQNIPAVNLVDIGPEDVDEVYKAMEWELLRYCATNAGDPESQKLALTYLISEKRINDALGAVERSTGHQEERKAHLISTMESMFGQNSGVAPGSYFDSVGDQEIENLANFLLTNSKGKMLMKEVLENLIERDLRIRIFPAIPLMYKMNDSKLRAIVETLEKHERWVDLKRLAMETSAAVELDGGHSMRNSSWSYLKQWKSVVFSTLERNLDRIQDETALWYVARWTFDLEAGKKAIDALAEMGVYSSIEELVQYDSDRIVFGTIEIGGWKKEVGVVPREHGPAIAEYAAGVFSEHKID